MKHLLTIIFILIKFTLFAQNTYVPDNNFEQALIDLGYDDVLDDYVLTANINTITYLNIKLKNIADLTGIEDFVALTELYCSNNQLTSLDMSANTNLTKLNCSSNQLTNIDVLANNDLSFLFCYNNQLVSLDVSQNNALTMLDCGNNLLPNIDVSANTYLTELYCHYNQLTSIDVSANTDLIRLTCKRNQLTGLDISANTSLTHLSCDNNQLTSLDLSTNTSLIYLHCYENQLTSIDVSANTALISFFCGNNQLTSIDVSANTALISFFCGNNQLTSIDLSANTSLVELWCYYNQLTSLDIRNGNNLNLEDFYAQENPDLTCIFVDNASYSQTNWTNIDATSTFVETEAECDALSVDAFFENQISIFPNPTTGQFTIDLRGSARPRSIEITDITGRTIKQLSINSQSTIINLKNQPEGIYFIKIQTENNIITKKIIKK